RLQIAMIEAKLIGVMLRATGLGVDDGERLVASDAGGEAHRRERLAAAGATGEADDQADVFTNGRTKGKGHAASVLRKSLLTSYGMPNGLSVCFSVQSASAHCGNSG